MTGYGDASAEVQGVHYSLELRSLNNRYYKALIRLPEDVSGLEAEIDALLRKRLSRGTITLTLAIRDESASAAYQVNHAALHRYLEQVSDLEANIEVGSLLNLPGVIQPPEHSDRLEQARKVVKGLVEQACDRLIAMRTSEGQGLARDLLAHKQQIASRIEKVAERAPAVVEEYHQRLRSRMDDLLARAQLQVKEVDLIKEVAVFAERCDIAEEVQRLAAHLDQFEQIIERDQAEPAGRTLDFIAQELLREANTMGSKSNDAVISRTTVEVKGLIDRIKEQVQNVE
jgi:uncharacterized protein (TIGR00255 family)